MKKISLYRLTFVLVIPLIFGSCSNYKILQRKYTSGRYIAKNGQAPKAKKIEAEKVVVKSSGVNNEDKTEEASINSNFPKEIIALAQTDLDLILKSTQNRLEKRNAKKQNQLIECDTLVLHEGKNLKVKILEINERKVRYQLCESGENETIFEIFKEKVKIIKYANGENKEFLSAPKKENLPAKNIGKKTNYGAFSLLFFIIGPFALIPIIISFLKWENETIFSKIISIFFSVIFLFFLVVALYWYGVLPL